MSSSVSFIEIFLNRIGLTPVRKYLGGAGPALGPWMDAFLKPHFRDYFSKETHVEQTDGIQHESKCDIWACILLP